MVAAGTESDDRIINGRTAIIAGNGILPVAVAENLAQRGQNPFLVPLRGEADSSLYQYEHCEISIVEFAKLVKALKKANISNVVLAGGVKSRPHLSDLRFDGPTLAAIPRLFRAFGKGDDALLRAFISLLEAYHFRVVGAHEVVRDLLAPRGQPLTRKKPDRREQHNIILAAEAAQCLGHLDVGQGAIAIGGRVVALEGAEGTDNMLKRIGEMRMEKRVPLKGGVLVKRVKPDQDARADLPTIGPETVDNAYKVGLAGICVEAERTFILQAKEAIERANQHGMFIATFDGEDIV